MTHPCLRSCLVHADTSIVQLRASQDSLPEADNASYTTLADIPARLSDAPRSVEAQIALAHSVLTIKCVPLIVTRSVKMLQRMGLHNLKYISVSSLNGALDTISSRSTGNVSATVRQGYSFYARTTIVARVLF